MIDYIKGTLTELTPTCAVIETAGVGFEINISLQTFSYLEKIDKQAVKLYVTEIIREDAHDLFGFAHPVERSLFLLLTSVSGVGANTARMIMSAFNVTELRNLIATDNAKIMCQVKGLGPKTAQRIIIDLKDKILKLDVPTSDGAQTFPSKLDSPAKTEALNALSVLGFNTTAASKALDKILPDNPDATVEVLIKMALTML